MALTQTQAAYLASLLPDNLTCNNARQRLLVVLVMLRALTDEGHPLSNADLRMILGERFGNDAIPAENTLAADIRAIGACGFPDLALHVTPTGYWCERVQLTPAKVRLMLNAVQASRFLTVEQSAELQEDLFSLVSRHQEDDLAGQVHVDQRVRKDYQQVFDTIDAVARAIHRGKKIEFSYTFSNFSGRPRVLAGDDGNPVRVETPIALYFSENNYYVETYTPTPWRHGREIMVSRADRMIKTRVSEEDEDHSRVVSDLRKSARRRMSEGFDMISGPQRLVFMRVRSDATNGLFDRFGFGLSFGMIDRAEEAPSTTALTLLKVPQAFTFFRWLSTTGEGIVMVEPPSDLVLQSGPWKRALRGVTRERLVEDYHQMVEGYLAYLDRARAPYL